MPTIDLQVRISGQTIPVIAGATITHTEFCQAIKDAFDAFTASSVWECSAPVASGSHHYVEIKRKAASSPSTDMGNLRVLVAGKATATAIAANNMQTGATTPLGNTSANTTTAGIGFHTGGLSVTGSLAAAGAAMYASAWSKLHELISNTYMETNYTPAADIRLTIVETDDFFYVFFSGLAKGLVLGGGQIYEDMAGVGQMGVWGGAGLGFGDANGTPLAVRSDSQTMVGSAAFKPRGSTLVGSLSTVIACCPHANAGDTITVTMGDGAGGAFLPVLVYRGGEGTGPSGAQLFGKLRQMYFGPKAQHRTSVRIASVERFIGLGYVRGASCYCAFIKQP